MHPRMRANGCICARARGRAAHGWCIWPYVSSRERGGNSGGRYEDGRSKTFCLNGVRSWGTHLCAFQRTWMGPQGEELEMSGLHRHQRGCESPFKGTRTSTHLSQSLWYCQQARGDLNGVKLTLYAYSLPHVFCMLDRAHRRREWLDFSFSASHLSLYIRRFLYINAYIGSPLLQLRFLFFIEINCIFKIIYILSFTFYLLLYFLNSYSLFPSSCGFLSLHSCYFYWQNI